MDVEPIDNDFERPISELSRQADTVNSFEPVPFSSSASEIEARNNDIKRWIETSTPLGSEGSSQFEPQINNVIVNNNNSCALTSETESCCKSVSKKGSTNYMPPVFRKMRLCLFYFLDKYECHKIHCQYSHSIASINQKAIVSLKLQNLKDAYKWALLSKKVFQLTFKHFVRKFSRLKDTDQLISMVDDVLVLDVFDRTPYIQELVFALQNADFTFRSAIETLVRNHGGNNVCLLDILLNLVIELSDNLEEDWILLKEILKYRTGEIDFGVVNDIIAKALQFQTRGMCINICEDIFNKHVNNFENIDKKLFSDFLELLSSYNLMTQCNDLKTKYKTLHLPNGVSPIKDVSISPSVVSQDDNSASSDKVESVMQMNSSGNEKRDCCIPELDYNEICDLINSLRSKNINLFIALLSKYKSTDKMDSFALNTFVYLKENQIDREYSNLLKSLGII